MNDQNKQLQMPLSEGVQDIEEILMDGVTGGGPDSSLVAITGPKRLTDPRIHFADGTQLIDKVHQTAVNALNDFEAMTGKKYTATIWPNAEIGLWPKK